MPETAPRSGHGRRKREVAIDRSPEKEGSVRHDYVTRAEKIVIGDIGLIELERTHGWKAVQGAIYRNRRRRRVAADQGQAAARGMPERIHRQSGIRLSRRNANRSAGNKLEDL